MVTLKSLGKDGELTVKRGAWGTRPLAFEAGRAVASATVARIPEKTIPSDLWFGVQLQPSSKPALKQNTEYTLEFDVRGDDRWDYAGQVFERVPRAVMISGIGDGRASVNAESQWYHCRISMTTADSPDQNIAFGVSEQIGLTEIKNIRLHEGGAERWSRDFENGKILLNMTRRSWTFDIGPGCRKLKGTRCPEVNTGEKIDRVLEVPAWDAVFLVKEQPENTASLCGMGKLTLLKSTRPADSGSKRPSQSCKPKE